MKTFTPEERIRLNLLYELLDANYRGLREFTQMQRSAILYGCLPATVVADINLVALSRATTAAWGEIQSLLAPPAEAAPETPPDSDPKETIQ
jgi:hypothetical protein